MNKLNKLLLIIVLLALVGAGCQKNYYSGKAKSSDCGCPNKKGMVGY